MSRVGTHECSAECKALCLCGPVPGCKWRTGHLLEESMCPPFVSRSMAEKLLRCGKTLIFLRCVPQQSPLWRHALRSWSLCVRSASLVSFAT